MKHLFSHLCKGCLFAFLVFFSAKTFAQVAPVNPPSGGFAIDGGLRANTPTSPAPFLANQGDWVFGPGGTGDSVLRVNGTPFVAATSGRAIDNYTSNDNIFANGSKFNDYISALHWTTNSAPDKNDINNGLYHVSTNTGNGDQWLFIAGDRLSTNGTSYIDFELLQGTVQVNGNGTFTGVSANGTGGTSGRTAGDINISMEYTNGGTKPNVVIYRWRENASHVWFWDSTGSSLTTQAFAETNRSGATDVPFGAFASTTYPQYAFVEAGINVSQLLSSGGNCQGISIHTLWIKTKAAATTTAALKDYMDPISVNFNFGNAAIGAISPVCVNGSAFSLVAYGSPAGGTFSGPGVSSNTFNPANAGGAGTKTITYVVSLGIGCSRTATASLEVTALPSASISGTTSVCKDASSPSVTFTGSGGTKPYTFNYNIGGGSTQQVSTTGTNSSITVAAPTGTVGSSTYNLLSVTDANCSNTATGSVTITINPLPEAGAGTSPAAQCYSASGNSFALSGTAQNGNPSWSVQSKSNNSLTVGITNGTTLTPTINVSGSSSGGTVTLLLSVASTTACGTATSTVTVTVHASPNLSITNPAAVCAPGTVDITAASVTAGSTLPSGTQLSYWTNSNGTGAIADPAHVGAGTYYIQAATSTTPSCTDIKSVTVTINPTPSLTITNPGAVCSPATVDITAAAVTSGSTLPAGTQLTYWTNSNGTGAIADPAHVGAGTYYIKATTNSTPACSDIKAVTVSVNATPALVITNPGAVCSPNTVDLTAAAVTAGSTLPTGTQLTYWTNSNGTGAIADPAHVGAGTYYIKAATNTVPSCSDIKAVTVTVNTKPSTPVATFIAPTTCTQTTYSVSVGNLGNGTYTLTQPNETPKTFVVPTNGTNVLFTGLVLGKGYSVTYQNTSNCVSDAATCGLDESAAHTNIQSERTISQTQAETTVKAYPNPFSDKIKFVITSPTAGKGNLEVYNMMGQRVKTVYQGFIASGTQTFEMSLPRQQVANLIYVLRIGDKKMSGKILQINQ